MELSSTTPADGTGGRLDTNNGAPKQKVLNDHDTSSKVSIPRVARRQSQKVPCLLSHFLTARGVAGACARRFAQQVESPFPPTGTSGTHACLRTSHSRRDKHREGARAFASASPLHMPLTTYFMALWRKQLRSLLPMSTCPVKVSESHADIC